MQRLLSILSFAFFIFLTLHICGAVNPGMKLTVSAQGMNKILHIGLPKILPQLQKLELPKVHGKHDHWKYHIKDIVLESLKIGKADIALIKGVGPKLTLSDISAHVHLHWKVKDSHWPHIKLKGSADAYCSDSTASIEVKLGVADGRPTVSAQNEEASLHDFKVEVHGHGTLGWLVDVLHKLFTGDVKNDAESALKSALKDAINKDAEDVLKTLPLLTHVGKYSEFNFSIFNITVETGYVTAEALGKFVPTDNPAIHEPFLPPLLPNYHNISEEITMVMGDFVANTLGFSFWEEKQLRVWVTASEVPKESPVQLNTSDFKVLVPPLYTKYPNKQMAMFIEVSSPPRVDVAVTGITAYADTDVTVYVRKNATELISCFTLSINVTMSGSLALDNTTLKPTLKRISQKTSLVHSSIGTFSVTPLSSILSFFLDAMIGTVNKYMAEGWPLPTVEHFEFVTPKMIPENHYFIIESDIGYSKK